MKESQAALGRIGWRRPLWMVALIFLFNPYFHGLDLLPDVIGYLLLIAGLRRVSLLDESFGEATRLLRRLAWLSVGRFLALVWIIAVPSADEQPTLLLLLCFVMGILELMAVIPACHQLFHGLIYLGSRMGGTVVLASIKDEQVRRLQNRLARMSPDDKRRAVLERRLSRARHGGDMADRICLGCQTFAVIKTVLCILPELTALTDTTYRAGATLINWYSYINGFRALAMMAGVVVGLVWLVSMMRYCLRIEADVPLWGALVMRCEEDEAAHPERRPAGKLRTARLLVLLAFAFCTNFSFDGVNILPGFVAALLMLAAILPLRAYLPRRVLWGSGVCLGLYAIAAAVSWTMTTTFFARYDLYAYFRSGTVQRAYDAVCVATVVESVAMVIAFGALAWISATLIHHYTGAHDAATHACTREQMIRRRERALHRHLLPIPVLGVLSAAMHAVYAYLVIEYKFIWMPDVALSALLLLFGWLRLYDLTEELDTRRMLTEQ